MKLSPEAAAAIRECWPYIEERLIPAAFDADRAERFDLVTVALGVVAKAAETWVENGEGPPQPYLNTAVRRHLYRVERERHEEETMPAAGGPCGLWRPESGVDTARVSRFVSLDLRIGDDGRSFHETLAAGESQETADYSTVVADVVEAALLGGYLTERQVEAVWHVANLHGEGAAVTRSEHPGRGGSFDWTDLARRMGVTRQTAKAHYDAACANLRRFVEDVGTPPKDLDMAYTPRPIPKKP